MKYILIVVIPLLCGLNAQTIYEGVTAPQNPVNLYPKVLVGLLVRNKAHTLPYFLHYLENIDYPKDRMILWIKCDHNVDNSPEIVKAWLTRVEKSYFKVYAYNDDMEEYYEDEKGPCHWSPSRFQQIIALRQEILDTARGLWADYVFYVDVDSILVNNQVLKELINQKRTVVAPLLNTTTSEWWSNFWGGMDHQGYYVRSEGYERILKRHVQGCFPVANVHSTFLINLGHEESRLLSFDTPPPGYTGPVDDVIMFASVAKFHAVPLHILNTDFFGWIPVPMEEVHAISQEADQFTHILLENIIYDRALQSLPYVQIAHPRPTKLGFDQIYMINLKRRPDRREKMVACFQKLGIEVKIVDAVDGKELNDTYLQELGVAMLPGYADPYHGRAMTMGEIGCYLSHYFIWQDIVANKYNRALIFEDDLRFEPYFTDKIEHVLYETHSKNIEWDLLYIGRKKLNYQEETWVEGSDILVNAQYSYWTLSYALSNSGATKLLEGNPIGKMVPVDEYIPIKFNRHPTAEWLQAFSPRDMIGLSAEPLLVYPTHYTGEPGYITDTEESKVIDVKEIKDVKGAGMVKEEQAEELTPIKPEGPTNNVMLDRGGEL